MSDLYTAIQNRQDYAKNTGTPFHQWRPTATIHGGWASMGWRGGYKVHLSLHEQDAERGATLVLPIVRDRLRCGHKIVSTPGEYARLNQGRQRGKFITLYCGPVIEGFTRAVNTLEPLLALHRLRPGPRPLQRLGPGVGAEEDAVGETGIISFVVSADFTG